MASPMCSSVGADIPSPFSNEISAQRRGLQPRPTNHLLSRLSPVFHSCISSFTAQAPRRGTAPTIHGHVHDMVVCTSCLRGQEKWVLSSPKQMVPASPRNIALQPSVQHYPKHTIGSRVSEFGGPSQNAKALGKPKAGQNPLQCCRLSPQRADSPPMQVGALPAGDQAD